MIRGIFCIRNVKTLYFTLFCALLVTACSNSFNEPVREYHEYWTENVTVGRVDVETPCRKVGGTPNIAAKNPVDISVLLTNARHFDLEVAEGFEPYYSVLDTNGEDVASDKSASLSPDKSAISLNMTLSDETEKHRLEVRGHFFIIKDEAKFEVQYSYPFIQNTPPDAPRNLKNPTSVEYGYHCLHFDYPLNLERNKDGGSVDGLQYMVECYFYDHGSYHFVDSKTLTKEDSLSPSEFVYYFDKQEPSLQYDYVVTAVRPSDGFKSEVVSTSSALGACYVMEPTVEFGSNGQTTGEKLIGPGGERYDVFEYTGETYGFTAVNNDDSAVMEVDINGVKTTGDSQDKTSMATAANATGEGFYKMKITVSKNLSRPIVIKRNYYLVPKLTAPDIVYTGSETTETKTNPDDGEDYNVMKYSYLSYDNLMLSVTNTYLGSGADMQIEIDGAAPVTTNVANHVLSDNNFHTVRVSITKEHCTPVPVHEKKIYAKMKDITLTVGYIEMRHDGADNKDEVELDGNIYCNVTGYGQRNYNFNSSTLTKTHSITWNTSFTITSKSASFSFWSDNMIDHDGSSGKDKMGSVNTSRSLATLRTNRYFDLSGSGADKKCSSWYHFTVGLTD
ncbi:MAG: hypothetical protein J5817_05575 [Treponema sp.]|nr:hypothetical protein [Treponema sp.]